MQKDKNFSVCVMIVLLIVLGIAAVIVLPQRIQAYRQSRKLNGAKVILYEVTKVTQGCNGGRSGKYFRKRKKYCTAALHGYPYNHQWRRMLCV